MKILITNDDGPSSTHSPFIEPFVKKLQETHDCIIVIPDSQKSWIGKGFEISKEINVKYLDIETKNQVEQETNWILMDATPATCVNIALEHICPDVDLVISGPNMGRNAGTGSILASGTVGAAIEAVLLGKRAIAVSFAYHGIESCHDITKMNLACDTACHLITQLISSWNGSPDLFNINIPLVHRYESIEWSEFHPGGYKTLFKKNDNGYVFHPKFDTVKEIEFGSDMWCIFNNRISITPLFAKYHIDQQGLSRYKPLISLL
jgi:5'/3'-nucleotidase SurE